MHETGPPNPKVEMGTMQALSGVCFTGHVNHNDADGAVPISIRPRTALAR